MLLYANVRQMHVHIVQFRYARIVLNRAEATESQFKLIRLQRPKRRHQHIQTHIELLATNQQRIINIPRNHITLLAHLRIERIPCLP